MFYKIIMLDGGIWMAENLRTMKFNDGTPIPLNRKKDAWETLKTPAYGWYNEDISYYNTYGVIYNWYAVGTGKLCPKAGMFQLRRSGIILWIMQVALKDQGIIRQSLKRRVHPIGRVLMRVQQMRCFLLPCRRERSLILIQMQSLGTMTNWWTSTEDTLNIDPVSKKPTNANIVGLKYNFHSKTLGTYQKESALPVRCKMDD